MSERYEDEARKTYLEDIDALSSNVAVDLILLVEVSSEHFRRLIDSMLNLDSNTTTSLCLLHDLNGNTI